MIYDTSAIKRVRRSKQDLQTLLETITGILDAEPNQISIRHLYYRLVGLNVIEKTEAAYHQLCSHLSKWRRSGDIAWNNFSDHTRWHIRQKTFDSVQDALQNTLETYRRNLCDNQGVYLEVWVEKDAMASIVSDITKPFGVPLFVCRGFASLSSLYSAGETFKEAIEGGKKVIVYHLGDYDPSGTAAGESIVKAMRDDFNVEIHFERIAVTPEQIEKHNLPTRPVKKTDKRAKGWEGGCVELDTMKPADIQGIVHHAITQHINEREWETMQATEEMEKQTLESILQQAA